MQQRKGKKNTKFRAVITSEEKERRWDGKEHTGRFRGVTNISFLKLIAEYMSLWFVSVIL